MRILVFTTFLLMNVFQEQNDYADYIYSVDDKSFKKLSAGHWLRLNSDGTGIFIEWMPCHTIWSDSLTWKSQDNYLIVKLNQDGVERKLQHKRDHIIPLDNDNVFMGREMKQVLDTARFSPLFRKLYFDNKAPCY